MNYVRICIVSSFFPKGLSEIGKEEKKANTHVLLWTIYQKINSQRLENTLEKHTFIKVTLKIHFRKNYKKMLRNTKIRNSKRRTRKAACHYTHSSTLLLLCTIDKKREEKNTKFEKIIENAHKHKNQK